MQTDAAITVTRRVLSTGVSLEVAAAGPERAPAGLVILLHGFPDLWQTWHAQIPGLVNAGFRVLAPNQRGYARSDKPRGVRAYDVDLLADDVIALAATEGTTEFRLVGHDWGGIIAWWTAARSPQHVQKVAILNAPHPGIFRRYLLRHPLQILQSAYVGFFQIPALPEALLLLRNGALTRFLMRRSSRPDAFGNEEWPIYQDAWRQPGAMRSMIHYYRALVRRPERTLRRRVQCPALVLWGKRDLFEQPGLADRSLQWCDAGRIKWWDEATHWLHREEPITVNEALTSFLLQP